MAAPKTEFITEITYHIPCGCQRHRVYVGVYGCLHFMDHPYAEVKYALQQLRIIHADAPTQATEEAEHDITTMEWCEKNPIDSCALLLLHWKMRCGDVLIPDSQGKIHRSIHPDIAARFSRRIKFCVHNVNDQHAARETRIKGRASYFSYWPTQTWMTLAVEWYNKNYGRRFEIVEKEVMLQILCAKKIMKWKWVQDSYPNHPEEKHVHRLVSNKKLDKYYPPGGRRRELVEHLAKMALSL